MALAHRRKYDAVDMKRRILPARIVSYLWPVTSQRVSVARASSWS